MLKIENLSHPIGSFRLEARFSVSAGERVALIGRSGVGKTSLLRLVSGLDPLAPGEGSISLLNRDLTRLPPEKRNIGFVFQEGALFSSQTVLRNAAFGLKMRGVAETECERQAAELLAKVGLGDRLRAYPENLSGGERQRVALARAMVWKPQALLLDEPFSALDAQTKNQVSDILLALLAEHAVPVLFVAHDAADVKKLSTRAISVEEERNGSLRRFQDPITTEG